MDATKKKAKPFKLKPAEIPEDTEQVNLAKWLNMRKVLWTHPPNGGNRDIITGARLKAAGVKRGVPDILIFTPPPKHPLCKGTAVELKKRSGGVVSEEQEAWLEMLSGLGWLTTVAYGWEHAVQFLKEAGY
jgi:hypothetical protein